MVQDVSPNQCWSALRDDPAARLVDVRTDAEWNFVGVPDLREAGQRAVLIPWQNYPSMAQNAGFMDDLSKAGVAPQHRVYFLCRSGARSQAAAMTAQAMGYAEVFNVEDGFEGPPDANGHRGTIAGWKASGLPWQQR